MEKVQIAKTISNLFSAMKKEERDQLEALLEPLGKFKFLLSIF